MKRLEMSRLTGLVKFAGLCGLVKVASELSDAEAEVKRLDAKKGGFNVALDKHVNGDQTANNYNAKRLHIISERDKVEKEWSAAKDKYHEIKKRNASGGYGSIGKNRGGKATRSKQSKGGSNQSPLNLGGKKDSPTPRSYGGLGGTAGKATTHKSTTEKGLTSIGSNKKATSPKNVGLSGLGTATPASSGAYSGRTPAEKSFTDKAVSFVNPYLKKVNMGIRTKSGYDSFGRGATKPGFLQKNKTALIGLGAVGAGVAGYSALDSAIDRLNGGTELGKSAMRYPGIEDKEKEIKSLTEAANPSRFDSSAEAAPSRAALKKAIAEHDILRKAEKSERYKMHGKEWDYNTASRHDGSKFTNLWPDARKPLLTQPKDEKMLGFDGRLLVKARRELRGKAEMREKTVPRISKGSLTVLPTRLKGNGRSESVYGASKGADLFVDPTKAFKQSLIQGMQGIQFASGVKMKGQPLYGSEEHRNSPFQKRQKAARLLQEQKFPLGKPTTPAGSKPYNMSSIQTEQGKLSSNSSTSTNDKLKKGGDISLSDSIATAKKAGVNSSDTLSSTEDLDAYIRQKQSLKQEDSLGTAKADRAYLRNKGGAGFIEASRLHIDGLRGSELDKKTRDIVTKVKKGRSETAQDLIAQRKAFRAERDNIEKRNVTDVDKYLSGPKKFERTNRNHVRGEPSWQHRVNDFFGLNGGEDPSEEAYHVGKSKPRMSNPNVASSLLNVKTGFGDTAKNQDSVDKNKGWSQKALKMFSQDHRADVMGVKAKEIYNADQAKRLRRTKFGLGGLGLAGAGAYAMSRKGGLEKEGGMKEDAIRVKKARADAEDYKAMKGYEEFFIPGKGSGAKEGKTETPLKTDPFNLNDIKTKKQLRLRLSQNKGKIGAGLATLGLAGGAYAMSRGGDADKKVA